jgi:hypothetical protein
MFQTDDGRFMIQHRSHIGSRCKYIHDPAGDRKCSQICLMELDEVAKTPEKSSSVTALDQIDANGEYPGAQSAQAR